MKGLRALIRLHTWELDGKRRELADLQRVEDGFHAELRRLADDMVVEQEFAKDSESGVFAYGGFAAGVIYRRKQLAQSIAEIQVRIEAKREEVAEAYQELKRYEITLANREKQERLEQERLDQANLDEISLVQYQRRAEGKA